MECYALQISPEAKGAYFQDVIAVAQAELQLFFPGRDVEYRQIGSLEFLFLNCLAEDLPLLLRLSFVQGIFQVEGDCLRPLEERADFRLHEDFVFGSKYRGKTNERLTQLLLNTGLAAIGAERGEGLKLLDPMAGRGTTLLWAMSYGLKARGIEQEAKVLADVRSSLKKWCKLHRVKHKLLEGFIGKPNRKGQGKFVDFQAADSELRLAQGDARQAQQLFKKEKFDLIVSDLPYGVQHFTTDKTRNPLMVLEACVESWGQCLKKNGAVVLAFNAYLPKRKELVAVFEKRGFKAGDFSVPHRMSEAIVRDVVVFRPA